MSLAILGLGTAVPDTPVNQSEAALLAERICCRTPDQAGLLPALYRQTGIQKRHLAFEPAVVRDVLDGTTTSGSVFLPRPDPNDRGPTTGERMLHYTREAPRLAVRAAAASLQSAGRVPRDITHLVTVSCTGFGAPGIDYELIQQLDLPATIERTHVGFMGCHGALNGLRVARAITGSQPGACVLLCAVELCGAHYHYAWDPKKMVANALFADGAAALVGIAPSHPPTPTWRATASGSCVFPGSAGAMTWTIGDHGFEMTLSTRVPDLIARHLRPWLETWLRSLHLAVDQIASWAVHPGGPRILRAVQEALGRPPEADAVSREILSEYGNMSSPTILFILERLRARNAPRPCVALGFGPGLTAEAALFE